jgi:lipopolysaccharide transport system ATP-binding protein
MAIAFAGVSFPPLDNFTAAASDGAVIGLIGEDGSGADALLRLAAGAARPAAGALQVRGPARLLGPRDPWEPADAAALLLDHALAERDAVARARASLDIERLRRAGATVLFASHEEDLILALSDEIWWLDAGRLAARGDPREVLDRYHRHIARRLRDCIEEPGTLAPSFRRGDGRARLLSVETLDAAGRPTAVWQDGEQAAVRVTVRFEAPVADPVLGILIRDRIGFEVYGINTALAGLKVGPRQPGDALAVRFSFECRLCPQIYTLTAASHDPDGVWHDWIEDAVLVTVAGGRSPAGVADLRARVALDATPLPGAAE